MNVAECPDLNLLMKGHHFDPHRFLGLHGNEIRLWRPGAKTIHLEILGRIVEARQVSLDGLFVYSLKELIRPLDYRVFYHNGKLVHDAYSFAPSIGAVDAFLFNKGCHYELYHVLGAQIKEIQGVKGVQFAVWAPSAKGVFLIGDFNHFDGRYHPMRSMGASGIWELFMPGVVEGEKYKFEIHTQNEKLLVKSDPYAFYFEKRPLTASIVANVDIFHWTDDAWMQKRKKASLDRPINVYEVHLGSWKKKGDEFFQFRELARELASYCKEMGFTHVELLPIMEHPLDESWGYQVTGFFAVTSRYGTVQDFQYFVNYMHEQEIGVILDWVPAHFPMDDFALYRFDGTALYEHEDPKKGLHPHWQTAIFNYSRKEVSNFLIASALFWLDKMHVDGLRVDAVASMLYLDYGRSKGEWIPNPYGGHHNLDAIEFLKHLNSVVHSRFPGVLMIAEESSSFEGVSHSEGLGFDLKWNMGWMNDTLRYFQRDLLFRKYHQNDLTFSLLYAFSEKFILVLSHDEVVHEKRSLLSKMPGPDWQKFAGLRLLLSYMLGHPGKKLIFMGGEIGQWQEWNSERGLDWHLLESSFHLGIQKAVKALNHLYLQSPSLWKNDFHWEGYEWVDFSDGAQSVISYLRKGDHQILLFVHHFSAEFCPSYKIGLKNVREIVEVLNTDDEKFGGSGQLNRTVSVEENGIEICLSPLATMIFEVHFV